jgi:hypothetical protein
MRFLRDDAQAAGDMPGNRALIGEEPAPEDVSTAHIVLTSVSVGAIVANIYLHSAAEAQWQTSAACKQQHCSDDGQQESQTEKRFAQFIHRQPLCAFLG